MKTDRTHTTDNFDYPSGYFTDFERRLNHRMAKTADPTKSSMPARKNLPLWWHATAATIVVGLFAFALWPKPQGSSIAFTEQEWLAMEIETLNEIEIIQALYEEEPQPDSLAHFAEFIEWDVWEWFLYENSNSDEIPAHQNQL